MGFRSSFGGKWNLTKRGGFIDQLDLYRINIVIGRGGVWVGISGTQGNHHAPGSGGNFDRGPQLVPTWFFPGLGLVVASNVLQEGFEQHLLVIPYRPDGSGLLAESRQADLEHR